jgi:hypothetical protein
MSSLLPAEMETTCHQATFLPQHLGGQALLQRERPVPDTQGSLSGAFAMKPVGNPDAGNQHVRF